MSAEQTSITWGGRNLGTTDAIMFYRGRLHVDALHGAAYLLDLPESPGLADMLWMGDYAVEIRVISRLPGGNVE